jgi:hypothetical protein
VSSIKPNRGSSEMEGGEEVSCRLVVAGGKGAERFEPAEEILDPVTGLLQVLIIVGLPFALRLGGQGNRI